MGRCRRPLLAAKVLRRTASSRQTTHLDSLHLLGYAALGGPRNRSLVSAELAILSIRNYTPKYPRGTGDPCGNRMPGSMAAGFRLTGKLIRGDSGRYLLCV